MTATDMIVSKTTTITNKSILFGVSLVTAVGLGSSLWLAKAGADNMPNNYRYSNSMQMQQSYPPNQNQNYPPNNNYQNNNRNKRDHYDHDDNDRHEKHHNNRKQQRYPAQPMMKYRQPTMKNQQYNNQSYNSNSYNTTNTMTPSYTPASTYTSPPPAYNPPAAQSSYAPYSASAADDPSYDDSYDSSADTVAYTDQAPYRLVNAGSATNSLIGLMTLGTIGGTLAYRQLLLRRLSRKYPE